MRAGLLGEETEVAERGKRDDLDAIGVALAHIERLASDRTRRAEDRDPESTHWAPPHTRR